ncbi:MAG: helix-turn-helix domain-containing protein [Lachnospiraceae bacterium]|nr:helix-turn-helix domain-containing protein [Lachnospiraceae bacterium]
MENYLAENIRDARKRMGITQEQLAERLGVTLGTVSKWERGASEPEIMFLTGLAEVFRVSVDALIGFSLKGGDADTEAERIENLLKYQTVLEVCEEYDRALRRFPNHFSIVLGAAACYSRAGTAYRKKERLTMAIEMYRHAIELLPQNKDPEINEVLLRNEIAMCYAQLKDFGRAVEEFKNNNVCGINDSIIGKILIEDEKRDREGSPYITKAFLNGMSDTVTVISAQMTYYFHTKEHEKAIRLARWGINYLTSLKEDPKKRAYIDKIIGLQHLTLACAYDLVGKKTESRKNLAEAVRIARGFDADPVYTLENISFIEHVKDSSVYDDCGPTAVDSLRCTADRLREVASERFMLEFDKMMED